MAREETIQIRRVIGDLEAYTETAVKMVTLEATANFTENTPVDTGWAQSNWIPYIGLPFEAPAPGGSRDERLTAAPGQANAQQAATAGVARYKLEMGVVYIINNVPYILSLNEGSSTKAPAGFVQAGITKAVQTVQRRLG